METLPQFGVPHHHENRTMAARLYPNTTNINHLEILAGVRPGTNAAMLEIETKYKSLRKEDTPDCDLGYEEYKEKQADHDIAKFNNFQTFGWGKVRHQTVKGYHGPDDEGYSGSETDLHLANLLLQANGIGLTPEALAMTEGVHWC